MKSWIVNMWEKVFNALRKISFFHFFSEHFPSIASHGGVEGWVLGNLLLSAVLLYACSAPDLRSWEVIAITYGGLRVFEVVIYLVNVLVFEWYRERKMQKSYSLHSYLRTFVLSIHNFIEIIFWFALFYRNSSWAFQDGIILNSFFTSLSFSFFTMTTFGHTTIVPNTAFSRLLTLVHSAIGLAMTLLILSRFLSLLPRSKPLEGER